MDNIQELAVSVLQRDGLDSAGAAKISQKLRQWTSSSRQGQIIDYRVFCPGRPSVGISENPLLLSQRLLRKKGQPLTICGPDLVQAASAALYLHDAGFHIVSLLQRP